MTRVGRLPTLRSALVAGALLSSPALACEEIVFSCVLEGGGEMLRVCHADDTYTLTEGWLWSPRRTLARAAGEVVYTPWGGIGPTYWASLGFPDGERLYDVSYSVEKDEDSVMGGALTVYRGSRQEYIGHRQCVDGTVISRLEEISGRFRN